MRLSVKSGVNTNCRNQNFGQVYNDEPEDGNNRQADSQVIDNKCRKPCGYEDRPKISWDYQQYRNQNSAPGPEQPDRLRDMDFK